MILFLTAHVFHRQLLARLVAENCLVLRTMILKGAADILHVRYRPHENQKDNHAHDTLQHIAGKYAPAFRHKAAEKARQQQEQRNRQCDADDGRNAENEFIQPFRAELSFHPQLKLGGRYIGLLILKKGCGIVNGLNAVLHGHEQAVSAAKDRLFPQGGRLMRVLFFCHQFTVGAAHNRTGLFRAFHDDALNDGLSADGGFLLRCHGLSPSGV